MNKNVWTVVLFTVYGVYQEYEHKEKPNVEKSKHPYIRSEGLKYETTAFMNPSWNRRAGSVPRDRQGAALHSVHVHQQDCTEVNYSQQIYELFYNWPRSIWINE